MYGYAAARVDERAHVYSSFGVMDGAYFVSDHQLEWPGSFGSARGTFRHGELTIHGGFADIGPVSIGDGVATLEGALGDATFEYNPSCTERDAAMGVMSLLVAIASSNGNSPLGRRRR